MRQKCVFSILQSGYKTTYTYRMWSASARRVLTLMAAKLYIYIAHNDRIIVIDARKNCFRLDRTQQPTANTSDINKLIEFNASAA